MRKKILFIFISFISIILVASFIYFFQTKKIAAGTEHNVLGFAWSENIGWISFNSESDGSSVNYGVNIDTTTGKFSGYAWSEHLGWISFNRADTGDPPYDDPCPDGTCIAKLENPANLGSSDVKVLGWARVLSVKNNSSNAGGWDGWIRFDHGRDGEVYIDSNGDFHGWAWSDMVLGWLSFNSSDPNAGGESYKVSVQISGVNHKPEISELKAISPDWCGADPAITLSWRFSDDDGDEQEQYQIEIKTSSGSQVLNCQVESEISSSLVKVRSNFDLDRCNPLHIIYGQQYQARVRVYDGRDWSDWSGWIDLPIIPAHSYPYPDFTPDSSNPRVGQVVTFEDHTKCYDSSGEVSCYTNPNIFYAWDFNYDETFSTSSEQKGDVTTFYNTEGNYKIVLRVIDKSITFPDNPAVCEKQKELRIRGSVPTWTEVAP